MPGLSAPKAVMTKRSTGSPGSPGGAGDDLEAGPPAADGGGEGVAVDGGGEADDGDQREVSPQDGLAAGVDVAVKLVDRVRDGRNDARMVVGHHVQDVDVVESRHGVGLWRWGGPMIPP